MLVVLSAGMLTLLTGSGVSQVQPAFADDDEDDCGDHLLNFLDFHGSYHVHDFVDVQGDCHHRDYIHNSLDFHVPYHVHDFVDVQGDYHHRHHIHNSLD